MSRLKFSHFGVCWPITKTDYILEKDQLWKLPDAHIRIVNVGRHLTHFKQCKTLDQKRVSTQVETIFDLQKYLRRHRGKLVRKRSKTS
jgi:hypothetical protein